MSVYDEDPTEANKSRAWFFTCNRRADWIYITTISEHEVIYTNIQVLGPDYDDFATPCTYEYVHASFNPLELLTFEPDTDDNHIYDVATLTINAFNRFDPTDTTTCTVDSLEVQYGTSSPVDSTLSYN